MKAFKVAVVQNMTSRN